MLNHFNSLIGHNLKNYFQRTTFFTDPYYKTISVAKQNREYFEIYSLKMIILLRKFVSPSCFEKN